MTSHQTTAALLINAVTILKIYRPYFPRVVPLTEYDATVAAAEGHIKALAAGKVFTRDELDDALASVDRVTNALGDVIRSLPAEVLQS